MSNCENTKLEEPQSALDHSESIEMNDKTHPDYIEDLKKEVEGILEPEKKIERAISYMEETLAKGWDRTASPHFRKFWQARTYCLELFKAHISPTVRTTLWNKYGELSKEVKKLKEVLDEESAFAIEQIEIAILALESDVEKKAHSENSNRIKVVFNTQLFNDSIPVYSSIQNELDLLNAFASRINALRKELIKTEMRVRKKNKFFQRLSLVGDSVFPRRKELIKEISDRFVQDVDLFIKNHFKDIHESLFSLREEIKNLQCIAKLLTLNTHAFNYTRQCLSKCWEELKNLDKERKKEKAERRHVCKENEELVLKKIEEMKNASLPAQEVLKQLDDIVSFMRSQELGKEEINSLREQIQNERKKAFESIAKEEDIRKEQERERQQLKLEKLQELEKAIDTFVEGASDLELDQIIEKKELLLKDIQSAAMHKSEKQELEKKLKSIRDVIAVKKEAKYLQLSTDDRQSLDHLKELLKERKERRQEVRDQIELLRKIKGSSQLDFVRALTVNEELQKEKEQLDKINHAIEELEEKIGSLEGS